MKLYIYFQSGNKAEISYKELKEIQKAVNGYTPVFLVLERPENNLIINLKQVECIGQK